MESDRSGRGKGSSGTEVGGQNQASWVQGPEVIKADEAEVKRTRVEGRLEEREVGRTPGPQQGVCI